MIYLLILLFLFSSCTVQKNFSPSIISKNEITKDKITKENLFEYGNTIIIRDNWGTPHIYGKTDPDAAFGLAYAHAEDDFQTIHDLLLRTRGKYASVNGKGKNNINASLDYLVGLLKIWDVIEKEYNSLDQKTIQLCEGYARVINYFIEKNNIKQYIYPVEAKDIAAGFLYKIPFFFDVPLYLSVLYEMKPEEVPETFTIDDILKIITKGSNVFAVSPSKSKDNSTLLAINSHQPWEGDLAWYEAHVHSEDGWNMTGGLFPGSPIVLVGFNENLGWGHTVNEPDIVDIYELTINEENNNQYLFDGKWMDFEVFDVNIDIKIIGKLGITHTEKAYWSIHGPVIKGEHATYAIRYSWDDNIKAVEQWYKMNKAKDFKEWNTAMSLIGVPMFNTGYADKEGNIFFIYSAKLPKRNNKYNWKKVVDGTTSNTLWKDFINYEKLPKLFNPESGFIQNCNNTPSFTSTGINPEFLLADTLYSGIESTITNRAKRAMELFSSYDKINYEDFKKIKFDLVYANDSNMASYVSRAKDIIKDNNTDDGVLDILNNWNFSTHKDNLNATLPIISFGRYLDSKPENITDGMLIKGLNEGINFLYKNYSKLKVAWGNVNRLIRGNVNLPLSGGPDILRAIYPIKTKTKQMKSIAGDAYMALVEWDENGNLKANSIHQFGSSILDQNSKHYSDQSFLFSAEKLKPAYLDFESIIKNSEKIKVIY